MTLTKTKPRHSTTAERQRTGQHRQHTKHYIKPYWPYLPMLLLVFSGFAANSQLVAAHRSVLGYATDMSVQSLFDDTNVQRQNNSEPALALNSELNQAAQAKANDMSARNYWSHITPDGQQPWTFITAAGYSYQTAGENLAYGFVTASDTITGWMNSPEHRANILNDSFRDVGFGIVNIPNYQNSGPETLVVAMYGSLPGEVSASVPKAPVAPAPVTLQPTQQSVPAPAPSPAVTPAPQSTPITVTAPTATTAATPAPAKHIDTTQPKDISRIQLVAANASLNTLGLLAIAVAAFAFVLFRHTFAWHKVLVRGERFVLKHPVLDMTAISLVTVSIILSQTAGFIR